MMSSPDSLRRILNLWPPLRASGIRITEITADASYAKIVWNRTWKNVNMHGVAFGGTLFSMADVMIGTLLQRRLGSGFEVWTRSASFQYLKPGRNGVNIEVELSDELVEWVLHTIKEDGYCNVPYSCMLKNPDGEVASISHQELHARPRGGGKRTAQPKHASKPADTSWSTWPPRSLGPPLAKPRKHSPRCSAACVVCRARLNSYATSVQKPKKKLAGTTHSCTNLAFPAST